MRIEDSFVTKKLILAKSFLDAHISSQENSTIAPFEQDQSIDPITRAASSSRASTLETQREAQSEKQGHNLQKAILINQHRAFQETRQFRRHCLF